MKTQIVLLVTSNVKDFYKLKNCIHFRKRGKSGSEFENDIRMVAKNDGY